MELFRRFMQDESSGGNTEKARKAAQAAALGAGLVMGDATPAHAGPIEHTISEFERTEAPFSSHDINQLALNLYREAANQPEKGQLAIAQVTIASALSPKAEFSPDGTIEGAIWKKNRFSWTRSSAKEAPLPNTTEFRNFVDTLAFALSGKTKREALSYLADSTGLPEDTLFYKRTDWDENNPSETRMSAATKEMFRSLTKVGTIGDHSFYADRRAR